MIKINENSIDIDFSAEIYSNNFIDSVIAYLKDELKLVLDGIIIEQRKTEQGEIYAYMIFSKRLCVVGVITNHDLKAIRLGIVTRIFLHTPDREEHQTLQRLGLISFE